MKMRKSLLLFGCVLAIVALLGVTNAFAQFSCTSKSFSTKTGVEGPGVFTVTVDPQTQAGLTTYTYTVTGANASKLFIYVKQGLGADLVSMRDGDPLQPGNYLTPHTDAGGFPPPDAWRVAHHLDGVEFNNIAIAHTFGLRVPERYKPEEGLTTVLLANGPTFEHCGPILGPMTPEAPSFAGSPVVSSTERVVLSDGCAYFVTAGATDNIITDIIPDSANNPLGACLVYDNPGGFEADTGMKNCHVEKGRPPCSYDTPPAPADSGIAHATGLWHCSTGTISSYWTSSKLVCIGGTAHK